MQQTVNNRAEQRPDLHDSFIPVILREEVLQDFGGDFPALRIFFGIDQVEELGRGRLREPGDGLSGGLVDCRDNDPQQAGGKEEQVDANLPRYGDFPELHNVLRLVLKKEGLLTRDPRMKERKKYGQKGARKRFQFSKR